MKDLLLISTLLIVSCSENPAHELNRRRLEREFPDHENVTLVAITPENVKIYSIKTDGYVLFVSVSCSSCPTTYTASITK